MKESYLRRVKVDGTSRKVAYFYNEIWNDKVEVNASRFYK